MKLGDSLLCLVKSGTDPIPAFKSKFSPRDLSAADKTDNFIVKTHMEKHRRYLNKEDELKESIVKLFDVIWG